jgi:hypothetical protein
MTPNQEPAFHKHAPIDLISILGVGGLIEAIRT